MNIAPIKPTIPFDLLDKLDIRVGTIEQVSDVPKTDLSGFQNLTGLSVNVL